MLLEAKSWRNEGLADELIERKKSKKTKLVNLGIGPKHRSQVDGDHILISFEDVIAKVV